MVLVCVFERDESLVKTRFHIYRLGLAAGIGDARGHELTGLP